MDRYCEEPTLAELLSDPTTLAMMDADGVDPRALATSLTEIAGRLSPPSRRSIDQEDRSAANTCDISVPRPDKAMPVRQSTARWDARTWRNRLRLVSGLVLLAFVICHLTAHAFLLVSLDRADTVLKFLMYPWRTITGTAVLCMALLIHYSNALWSIYVRRYLRLSNWEAWQLVLGLCIPPLLIMHVTSTRIAESLLAVSSQYSSVLIVQWQLSPWLGAVQMMAVLAAWIHGCIGLHFWLRMKPWYARARVLLLGLAFLLPTVALSGYVTAGNQILRAGSNPDHVRLIFERSNLTDQKRADIGRIARAGSAGYIVLTLLPFAGRYVRGWLYRRRRPPMLSHPSGRILPVLPGATVLETLRAHGIPHASFCGGRGRCTTCRVLVTKGLDTLPEPSALEAVALARISAPPGMRLACQTCPTGDISIIPLLAADASAADGSVRAGFEGTEQLITVLFVDLRRSSLLARVKMPYDFLYILNQFFDEMKKALDATHGHYAHFAGDGLMALYGLDGKDPATGAADALRGAREMLARMDQLNSRLRGDLPHPLRIGIGIHFGEAIVGAMGPPAAQIVSAIGQVVNTCARLEKLTKEHQCRAVVSRRAAEMAGLVVNGRQLHRASLNGMDQSIEFYTLNTLADLRV
jgi:adenylate cyclase